MCWAERIIEFQSMDNLFDRNWQHQHWHHGVLSIGHNRACQQLARPAIPGPAARYHSDADSHAARIAAHAVASWSAVTATCLTAKASLDPVVVGVGWCWLASVGVAWLAWPWPWPWPWPWTWR